MEVKFHTIRSDKIMILLNYNKSIMCMVMPRGTTEKIIPKDMLQNAINESR